MERQRGFERLEIGVQLPRRETRKSAGYDIRANEDVVIYQNEMVPIHTGLTAYMNDDEFLDLRIRSGMSYKNQLTLQNDAGVIDADYYGKEIKVMIRNEGPTAMQIFKGDRIAQGIFTQFLLTDDDEPVNDDRIGGLGSTGER